MPNMNSAKDSIRSWLVCSGAFVAYFLETGLVKCLGVMLPDLREQFTSDTWVIGLIISLLPGFGAVSCLLAGPLKNRYSARVTTLAFGLLSSAGLIIGSLAKSVYILLITSLLTGFSVGVEVIAIAVLPDFFDKYYNCANSLVHTGLSVGIMVMPLLTQFLLDIYGWRGTFLILSGINLHILVFAAVTRPVARQSNVAQVHPTDNDNNEESLKKQTTLITQIMRNFDLELLANYDFKCLLCLCFSEGYFHFGWLIYFVPHALQSGFQPYEASSLATVGGIGHFLGCVSYPIVGKVLSNKKTFYLSALCVLLALSPDPILSAYHTYFGLMVSSFVINVAQGITSCCLFGTLPNVIKEKQFSNATSLMFIAYSAGTITTGFLTGWLFDKTGSYTAGFLILSVAPVISLIPWFILDVAEYIRTLQRYSLVPSKDRY